MRRFLFDPMSWVIALLAMSAVLILAGCQSHKALQVGSTVKVILTDGHGSGVHVGDGYVLTAAHVAGKNKSVKLQFDDKSVMVADVMWSNEAKDVALLRFKDNGRVAASHLSCSIAGPGTRILARGNPLAMENLSFEGRINGAPFNISHFENVLPADLTILGGMSGGGVFDENGDVIGISVAHAVTPMGMFPSWTRVGLIVPGKTICELMGKGV